MHLTEIDNGVFVCGQITEEAVDRLAHDGIRTIICNRPNNEEKNQPDFEVIEKRAKKHGMTTFYIPVTPPHIDQKSVEDMAAALQSCPYPILAYCKSGHRAETLYKLAKN